MSASPFSGFGIPMAEWGESLQGLLAQSIESFADACYELLTASFSAGSFTPGTGVQDWWVAVIGGTLEISVDGELQQTIEYPGMLNVMVMAMIPVLIIFVSIQVILSVIRASTAGMLRAFGSAVLAVPATYLLGGIVFLALEATDIVAEWVLDAGGGEGDAAGMNGIYMLLGMSYDPEANNGEGGAILDANFEVWQQATVNDEAGRMVLPWVILAILTILSVCLMGMMIFRTVVVLVATMFAPVAVFSLSLEAAKGIFAKWVSFIVALLLAKPIAAGIVMFGLSMTGLSNSWVQLVAGAILIIIAAAMPLLMLAIVSFMIPDSSASMERTALAGGSSVSRTVSGGARRVSRVATGVGSRVGRTAGRTAGRATRGAAGLVGAGVNRAAGGRGAGGRGDRSVRNQMAHRTGSTGGARTVSSSGQESSARGGHSGPGARGSRGPAGSPAPRSGGAERAGGATASARPSGPPPQAPRQGQQAIHERHGKRR